MHPAAIGPFRIERELGRGGMGEVYLARDTRLDRPVAIKALPAHLAQDPDRLARFQREAKVLASLNHPGIAAIYGLEEAGGHQYLVLEYVEGETLADRLTQGPVPVHEALGLARQIAEALEVAHEKGIVHRDLKPGNVMVTPEGAVKVLDFGLARSSESGHSSTVVPARADSPTLTSPAHHPHSPTIPGAIMGTAGYMSPEQARGKPVDKRSDIFSFGCVLYEMLTGAMPFRGETVADAIGATLHKETDLTLVPAGTPRRVRDLLITCLAKDRKNRLHDIGDARLELERAMAAGASVDVAPAGARPRGLLLTIGVVLIGSLAMIALGAALWRSLGQRPAVAPEPRCVAITIPSEVVMNHGTITDDGRTLVIIGRPRKTGQDGPAAQKLYVRPLDRYEFQPLAGTEGVTWVTNSRDGHNLLFLASTGPATAGQRLAMVPVDGSAPATTLAELPMISPRVVELPGGDILYTDGQTALVRLSRTGDTQPTSIKMDVGRPNVAFVSLVGSALPGGRSVLANVVTYGARGYLTSLGSLDVATGRVKMLVEDAGPAAYTPSGHIVFARGDSILAAPFDLEREELKVAPVAVWGGLASDMPSVAGEFRLAESGTLLYRPPPPGGWNYGVNILNADGKLEPWLGELKWLISMWPSPDGRRVLMLTANARNIYSVQVSPIDQPELVKVSSESNADCDSPVWSPDGKQIAYVRLGKDDADGVYIRDLESGLPRRIYKAATGDQMVFPSAWLPGGNTLLATLRELNSAKGSLMRLPITDKEATTADLRPFMPSESNRWYVTLSSTGRAIAFASDESGKPQVWVAELRPNGEPGRPIMLKTVGYRGVSDRGYAWALDGKSIYVLDERERLQKIAISLEPQLTVSAPVEVADFEKLRIQKFTPIGNDRFLVGFKPEVAEDVSSINIVFNWAEILSKKVPVAK